MIVYVVAVVSLLLGYFLGHALGYNSGYDAGYDTRINEERWGRRVNDNKHQQSFGYDSP
jgi:hypothetical protein